MTDEQQEQLKPYWEFDADGHSPKPPLRECPLCPSGGQPYFTRTVNGTNMIYVGCSQCGLELKAALIMVAPTKEQPSKDILAIWNTRAITVPTSLVKDGGGLAPERLTKRVCKDGFIDCGYHSKLESREVEYVRGDIAATTMRSRCVEKVREMYDVAANPEEMIAALESLPLEQEEQEKR